MIWTPVSEALPELRRTVLVFMLRWETGHFMQLAARHMRRRHPDGPLVDVWTCDNGWDALIREPTHWMPLPEPPTPTNEAGI